MSIQSSINQAIGVASLLETQTAGHEIRKQAKIDAAEVKKIDEKIEGLAERQKSLNVEALKESRGKSPKYIAENITPAHEALDDEITKKTSELVNKKAELTGDYSEASWVSLKQKQRDLANEKAKAEREIKQQQLAEFDEYVKNMPSYLQAAAWEQYNKEND